MKGEGKEGGGGGEGQIDSPPGKTTLKKPSLIRANPICNCDLISKR